MNDKQKDCWPDFYPPELDLPPDDSEDASGIVYRLVKSIPPTEQCFVATHIEQPHRHLTCKTLEKKQAVYGTSVWVSKERILEVMASLPEAFRQKKLASGTVSANMGKMRKTREDGHFTLWLRTNSNIHLNFSEVK
ncbi:TPA: hypothetical protein PPN70_000499 [Serratia rubidaea]|nr:hypothetical protein [Serratia rubidaea]HDJ1449720.1 hypothetical protein [Serratia rubidaea]HDJ2774655.1 hypothetical protein [Serratia rubidaea]